MRMKKFHYEFRKTENNEVIFDGYEEVESVGEMAQWLQKRNELWRPHGKEYIILAYNV